MTIKKILKSSESMLKENKIEEAYLKSRMLLMNLLNVSKEYLKVLFYLFLRRILPFLSFLLLVF